MNRCLRLLLLLSPLLLGHALAATQPNVVVFLTDDQGWGDLSLNGNTNLSTPNIDRLASQGASFDRFFVCPVCSPTRAEFLTGRYHTRLGVYSTSAGGERMNLDEKTVADTFKAAGYATGAFGKWHNGMQAPYHPNCRGFDEYYGFCSGHWGNYYDPMLERNGTIVQGKGFCVDDFTEQAMAFMEEQKGRPFFVYLPYNTPHSPMQVPDRWWNKFKDADINMHNREPHKENELHLRAALAMCENIDWNVGRVMDKLDSLGIADDTIVLYLSDNGPNGVRWNGDMKGRKGSTDEGGVRSPLVVRWPDEIAAGKIVRSVSSVIDLHPTLADLAGIKPASTKALDGISLKPILIGKEQIDGGRVLFNTWKTKLSLRNQRFRLDNKNKLFELATDPGQRTDVSEQFPEQAKRLRQLADRFRAKHFEGYFDDDRPFVIGHASMQDTQIPARDGTAHGNIKRSNKFPNCSYFTNWLSTEDKVTWSAQVGEAGAYAVDLYYTCPAADIGSTIQLRFEPEGHAPITLQTKLTEAHDPPLRGEAEDRSPRSESYVKDFKLKTMGLIDLPQGRGVLSLQATEIPGSQCMDFRLLMLRRQ